MSYLGDLTNELAIELRKQGLQPAYRVVYEIKNIYPYNGNEDTYQCIEFNSYVYGNNNVCNINDFCTSAMQGTEIIYAFNNYCYSDFNNGRQRLMIDIKGKETLKQAVDGIKVMHEDIMKEKLKRYFGRALFYEDFAVIAGNGNKEGLQCKGDRLFVRKPDTLLYKSGRWYVNKENCSIVDGIYIKLIMM